MIALAHIVSGAKIVLILKLMVWYNIIYTLTVLIIQDGCCREDQLYLSHMFLIDWNIQTIRFYIPERLSPFRVFVRVFKCPNQLAYGEVDYYIKCLMGKSMRNAVV